MIIDGEKWACEACVRGHRVSNCQHSDRQLQHINKKGRPVSQCSHCRTLRKSRSAHVKCDCGEKTHPKGPCTHLQDKGDSKADHCSCGHGGRCSCALKKEHLDPVPELVSDIKSPLSLTSTSSNESRKPRLTTAQSDSPLTVFANGHHKPAHKHNQMAHKCGAPYTIPRSNTIQGTSDFGNRSVDSLPATNTADTERSASLITDSIVHAQQNVRKVKSAQGSPQTRSMSNFDHLNGQLPPLDLDFSAFNDSLTFGNGNGYFTPDADGSIFSAGLSTGASVDWSQFNLGFEGTAYESFAGFDFNGIEQPPLSSSTSAETSEVDDIAPLSGPSPQNPPSLVHQQGGSDGDASEPCESDSYRLSTASSYMGLPQTQMLRNNGPTNLDIDDFLKGVSGADATQSLYDFSSVSSRASQHTFRSSFDSENSSQKYAPTNVSVEDSFQIPVSGDEDEALWMTSFNPNAPALIADEVMEPTWL